MKDATQEIISELKARGYRITKAREAVIGMLSVYEQPLTIQKLCTLVKEADEVSVYRTIGVLVEEGFVEELGLPGETTRYALSHGHHHHAVCTTCGFMEHIECAQEKEQVSIPSTFKNIQSHEVTFYGLCKKCA